MIRELFRLAIFNVWSVEPPSTTRISILALVKVCLASDSNTKGNVFSELKVATITLIVGLVTCIKS